MPASGGSRHALAGFAKRSDEEICACRYRHEPLPAPTQELLSSYQKKRILWPENEERFLGLMAERRVEAILERTLFDTPTVLLCSEATPEYCHRRLVIEYLGSRWGDVLGVHL
ncbi:MAG: DUF488 domain-containing protein [Thermoleophilia bacterium]|nr:DUF488 domain-containing protein [Thermoleophilia bacterium]